MRFAFMLQGMSDNAPITALTEAAWNPYDAWVGPYDPFGDVDGWRTGGPSGGLLSDLPANRDRGQDAPVFQTEQDLADLRGIGRLMGGRYGAGVNAVQCLTNYTIGTGYTYTAKSEDEAHKALVAAVQKCIDVFLDANDWPGDLEREIHDRSRRDGEVFIHLRPEGWKMRAAIVEPSLIREPQDARGIEDWLGCSDEQSCWSFGVHTLAADRSRLLGLHVVWDGRGDNWDYVPSSQCEHIKRNVDRNVKRGVTDFYPIRSYLAGAEKVLTNTQAGAAVQAAIAFIRQHAVGTTQGQVSSLRSDKAFNTYTEGTPSGASRIRYQQKLDPGTIIDVPNGQEYKAGPMGAGESAPNFISVIQAALRYVGNRWSMPEYMISGDASNANYSSTLVAESPFTKAREADQAFYVSRFKRVIWKVLAHAFNAGYFASFGIDWPTFEAVIDVDIETPKVASRDRLAENQANEIESRAGVLSAKTWAAESGRDYDVEVSQGAKVAAPPQPFGMGLSNDQQSSDPIVRAVESVLRESYP